MLLFERYWYYSPLCAVECAVCTAPSNVNRVDNLSATQKKMIFNDIYSFSCKKCLIAKFGLQKNKMALQFPSIETSDQNYVWVESRVMIKATQRILQNFKNAKPKFTPGFVILRVYVFLPLCLSLAYFLHVFLNLVLYIYVYKGTCMYTIINSHKHLF